MTVIKRRSSSTGTCPSLFDLPSRLGRSLQSVDETLVGEKPDEANADTNERYQVIGVDEGRAESAQLGAFREVRMTGVFRVYR